ncbi:MAG: sigma-70 family RNA polymerase sigma factor [bacterium]|nr:sigma-70 family RNA polymerase sigma factor [bacterium]
MTENILEYENLVLSYASKFRNYYDIEDLKHVGMIGLMKAVENYKVDSNTKFTTYAYLWIKGEILKYIREDRNIKFSKKLLKISRKIEEFKQILRQQLLREPTLEEVSLYSDIDLSLIQEAEMSKDFVLSLDLVLNDDEGKDVCLYDTVSYQEYGYDSDILDLREAIEQLDPEERQIIQYRYFDGMTQSETSKKLGMHQVKVSREEAKILQKLNKMVA